jgi:hypothetical protein
MCSNAKKSNKIKKKIKLKCLDMINKNTQHGAIISHFYPILRKGINVRQSKTYISKYIWYNV